MAKYLETAGKLHDAIENLLRNIDDPHVRGDLIVKDPDFAIQLGHIVNLAVRCAPRGVQGTVRKNIVATAMRGRCNVTMTKEPYERRDGTSATYNMIHITPRAPGVEDDLERLRRLS